MASGVNDDAFFFFAAQHSLPRPRSNFEYWADHKQACADCVVKAGSHEGQAFAILILVIRSASTGLPAPSRWRGEAAVYTSGKLNYEQICPCTILDNPLPSTFAYGFSNSSAVLLSLVSRKINTAQVADDSPRPCGFSIAADLGEIAGLA